MSNARERRRLGLFVALAAAAAGYLVGISGGGASAVADGGTVRRGAIVAPTMFTPPIVAVEKGGFAIVGAADSRYYVVRADGTTCLVEGARRSRDGLYWR